MIFFESRPNLITPDPKFCTQRRCKRQALSNGSTVSEAPAPSTTPRSTRLDPKCGQVCRNSLMKHHYGAGIRRTQRWVPCLILPKRRRHNALTPQPRPPEHFHQVCWTLQLSHHPKRLTHPKIPSKPCLRPPHQSQMLKKRARQIRCRPLLKHARSQM